MAHALYTIGYSSFSINEFITLLERESIGCLVDVRGAPEISHFEAYRKNSIKQFLNNNGIYYLSLSQELGARPQNPALYTAGAVDFAKVALSSPFIEACGRIRRGLDKLPVCLMCAQKDPLNCHRSILVTRQFSLLYQEISILHFTSSGAMETQGELEKRLLKKHGYDQGLLYCKTPAQNLDEAYRRQEKQIAWRKGQ